MLRLRSHIPIGAPARREPADGTESPMRVVLGFEPAWFHTRCDVDFSERWHRDPMYRQETLVCMKRELCRAFPSAAQWDLDREDDTWTISGVHGAYPIALALGCELAYAPDRWPVIALRPERPLEEWSELDVRAVAEGETMRDLERQMAAFEARGRAVHGYLNWQGVLNNAFHVTGERILTAMSDCPQTVHRFLGRLCDLMILLARSVQERQRRSGFPVDQLDVSNCTINMISPRMYAEFVLPHDRRIAESFALFGVHTCGWDATPYLELLAGLPRVGYIDMGAMSDLRKARALFPEARRAVMYSPVRLQDATLGEIETDMRRICGDYAPCDIVMADIQATTSDDRVNDLLAICRKVIG
ncbi:MAG: hypothetical protein GX446_18480 [Chthonomonadales bacterium]|nr:hypothetical protein [Chthonomonadales bacterium]